MSETRTWQINITGETGLCQWITDQGGPSGLTTQDVLYIIDVRLNIQQPGWTITTTQALGVIDYRLGNIEAGNNNTGCEFT